MSELGRQSDKELAAAAQMLVQQLSTIHRLLVRRGIECDYLTYESGEIKASYTRVTKEKIA